jgi:hypothetical protein
MTAQRPDRPVTLAEELALAEARDLPPRLADAHRTPIAERAEEYDTGAESGPR